MPSHMQVGHVARKYCYRESQEDHRAVMGIKLWESLIYSYAQIAIFSRVLFITCNKLESLIPVPCLPKNMVKNLVSTLLLAISSLCHVAFAGGAIVMKGDECDILNGDGKEEIVTGKLTTIQGPGKIKLIHDCHRDLWHFLTPTVHYIYSCDAQVTPPSSGKAAYFDYDNTGFTCGDNNYDWHETVSASGHAHVFCLITPSAPPK
jgi:hypothetical protein